MAKPSKIRAYSQNLALVDVFPFPLFKTSAPTAADKIHEIGQIWVYKDGDNRTLYGFGGLDSSGDAVWNQLGAGGGDGIESVVSDSGTAIPVANAISIVGAGGITTSASGNVITINDGVSSLDFTTDSGSATVTTNNINILGGTNINTSGATDDVTINLDANITVTSIDAGNLNMFGNTLSSQNTNGDIILSPDSFGEVKISYATEHSIALFGASGAINEIGPLTNGQLIVGSTGAAPVAANITSSGGSITITNGAGTINLETAVDVGAADFVSDVGTATESGGTLNVSGGTNINTAGAGNTLTINLDSAITITEADIGNINIATNVISSSDLNGNIVLTPNGTGLVAISYATEHAIALFGASGVVTEVGPMTNGQILVGSSGAAPVPANITSTGGSITISNGAGTINLETAVNSGAVDFVSDSGTASEVAGSLNVLGGTNINTSGAGSTLTINLDADISVTSADIGNINIATNVISSTDTNGNITFTPDGTGLVALSYATENAIPVFGASGVISEVGPLTNGQLLVGSTGAAPVAAAITSTGGSVTITNGAGTINLETTVDAGAVDFVSDVGTATEVGGSLNVSGGTNINTAGAGDTLTVNLDANITVTSIDASNLNLFGNTISSQNTNGDIILSPDSFGEVKIAYLTEHAIPLVGASGAINELGPLTNGQLIVGSTGAAPVAAALTSTGGSITITNGAGTINLEAATDVGAVDFVSDSGTATESGGTLNVLGTGGISTSGTGSTLTIDGSGVAGGTSWSVETTTTNSIAAGEGVYCNNAAGVTVSLPATCAVGDTFQIVAMDAAGFTIDYGTGQSVQIGSDTTTVTSGTVVSTGIGDWVELVCNVANTSFFGNVKQGNVTTT